jgi:Bpu10I restriction endonuclease
MRLSTPHGDKLKALLANPKLPQTSVAAVQTAIGKYNTWVKDSLAVTGDYPEKLAKIVQLVNEYKNYIDYDLIFMCEDDFLYRQKGQLKLDNTVLEEFLPLAVTTLLTDELDGLDLNFGPTTCFAGVYFDGVHALEKKAGLILKQKDQDFAISRKIYVAAASNKDMEGAESQATSIAYLAAECKTNLDKTMFQEAAATSSSLKASLPSAKYFLICEWLDMKPISTGTTAIDEILVFRKAKRLGSDVRSNFSSLLGRKKYSQQYRKHLEVHPINVEVVGRFIEHARQIVSPEYTDDALERGYF